jgi:epoxide hydrolase 4
MGQAASEFDLPGLSEPARAGHHRVNGVLLHHVEAGAADAPLVILLHGFPDFWWGWRHQIGDLASAGFRVLAPDQRGYNLSGKPIGSQAYDLDTLALDIIGLADAFGSSSFRLVGHDFGGLVAWQIATRHPERVERLAVINAPHPQIAGSYMQRNPTQMMRSSYMGFFQLPWLPEALLSAGNFAALKRSLRASSRAGVFSSADLERYARAWAAPGALTGMLDWYRALRRRPDLKDARVPVPTLLIWGMGDQFLEPGLARESLALCDQGQLLEVENASHWVHLEEPARVNEALVGFLTPAAHRPSGQSPGA